MLNSSMDNGFGDTLMLYTPLYQASSNKFEGRPEYNAVRAFKLDSLHVAC